MTGSGGMSVSGAGGMGVSGAGGMGVPGAGGRVNDDPANCGSGPPPAVGYDPTVVCTDEAPLAGEGEEQYTCAQQAGWGKCSEPWMEGYCFASCGICALPPPPFPVCAACDAPFRSGVNLAWINFSGDVPNPDLAAMSTAFKNVAASGGPFVRWWFHVNGANTPGYDANGITLPIQDVHITDMVRLLNQAHADGAQIVLTLWSFDMLQGGQTHPNGEAEDIAANTKLLTDDVARQAYIDNYLTPLVAAIKGHPALHSFDVFNEPEGMSDEFGWTPTSVPMASIQKTTNWIADAIHKEWGEALVSVGAWSFQASSDVGDFRNYYSDAELLAAGQRPLGTVDFYQVHYYSHLGEAANPFTHPASYWELDKPIVIGEFWPDTSHGLPLDSFYTNLFDDGYAGAWAWQYQNIDGTSTGEVDNRWPSMQAAMAALTAAQPTAVALTCE